MTIADSDVLIDYLRGREPSHGRVRAALGTGRLATTSVNAFELASGAHGTRELAKVETLLAAMTVLPLDARAADLAANVRRTLESQGKGIGMADYLIAGVCLSQSVTLMTRNLDHFRRVSELQIAE